MKILNETVYDSDDLAKVVEWTRGFAHQRAVENHRRYNTNPAPPPQPLPEVVRFGYYAGKADSSKPSRTGVSYCSHRGGGYRSKEVTIRIGIVRPSDLPIEAMEFVAREASGDRKFRTLPESVLVDLVKTLAMALFSCWTYDTKALDGATIPQVHYEEKADRESAKASKAQASIDRLRAADKAVYWAKRDIQSVEERLEKVRSRLSRAEERAAKLRAKGVTYEKDAEDE